tara:strand:+ start:2275 stop:3405 length:1131 start_codon:yes stop_codon:yes gene_type:complete
MLKTPWKSYFHSTKDIGSDFDIPLPCIFKAITGAQNATNDNKLLLATGRDSLYWILKALNISKEDIVLLPSYLCGEVLKPFVDLDLNVQFYSIHNNFEIDEYDLALKLTSAVRILLLINYWGFPLNLPGSCRDIKNSNTIVLEDNTHSLLSSSTDNTTGDRIRFASYRKLLPIIDGAEVSWDHDIDQVLTPIQIKTSILHRTSICIRIMAAILKRIWLVSHGLYPKITFRSLFQLSEKLISTYYKPAPMSLISQKIYNSLNLEEIISIRRSNFEHLDEELAVIDEIQPLFRELPVGVCPLGYPILVNNRDGLIRHLIRNHIYPPIHWNIPSDIDKKRFSQSWQISKNILTLPTDQRYCHADMTRMASEIKRFFREV